jgi:hypothetical protein
VALDMSERMLFVIGAPRSGTTLLMRMLNVHGDVATRPEPHLLTPLAHLGYFGNVTKAPYDAFQAAEAAKAWVKDLPAGEADYVDALRAYADGVYGKLLEPTGRRYFLDKTPAYGLILPFVARLYPRATYVVLTRHPFAVFSSYAASFFDDDWAAAHAFNPIVERYVPALAEFVRSRPVERLYHVKYEDLVRDPAKELAAICATAGIPYSDDLIEYGKRGVEGEGLGDPIGVKAHDRPVTESIDKWARSVAHNEPRIALLRQMVAGIDDRDLAVWGFDRAGLWSAIESVDPEQAKLAQNKAKRWDRHHVQRRVLMQVRKNVQGNALGRMIARVRFTCDVLLRDSF